MKLEHVLNTVPVIDTKGDLSGDVSSVCHDSKQCLPGSLFVALRGRIHDGHDYVGEAFKRGARFVVNERDIPDYPGLTTLRVTDSRRSLSILAANFYGHPSRRLSVTGITGTNGKTTVTYLLESILKSACLKVGVIGTINCRYDGSLLSSSHTTPEATDLHRMLAVMADAGVTQVAMEVSSHAIDLHRADDVTFRLGLFTNLSGEHLDYHGSMESYYAAKKRFFTDLLKGRPALINGDDFWGRRLAQELAREGESPVITFGVGDGLDLRASSYRLDGTGITATLETPRGRLLISSRLAGMFNLSNLIATVALAQSLDIPERCIREGIADAAGAPGRLERVDSDGDVTVFVDYAHTEDGLRNVLEALRGFEHNRLITVFGCGGERDRTKRPRMGRAATELSDCTVITSDNPRGEDPAAIISEIEAGIKGAKKLKAASPTDPPGEGREYRIIEDRRQAIDWAIARAAPGDIVLIAGKGHEDYQILGHRRISFDDRLVAAQCLEARRTRSVQ